ncbi:MAG: bifunctional 4-hydroxy-2-oxoglutarate aldolase/2-dehydro-3-deoxy-phosphogluconate aldolase, partial [Alistipes sp.]|nr:bifunctional 4-hydroxy-2-oxoglutarate aldolase/2-dehydro-3-deoxy-phosphogluconate aldolase [Alistipes sp.]
GLMAPMPWTKIMVTGGVEPTAESLSSWFKAGAFAVGMGSKLFPAERIANSDWGYIAAKCKEALECVAEIKKR